LSHALADGVDPHERLSADDMATQREEQFLAAALAAQRQAGAARLGTPGSCTWCRQACLPAAVFCDADCRADHEAHQQRLRRQGRA
jgi:hypothetical protein